MIVIDSVHDFLELVRPLLQEGPVRIVAASTRIDLPPTKDLKALPEESQLLINDTIKAGGQLRVVSDIFPPIIVTGRTVRTA